MTTATLPPYSLQETAQALADAIRPANREVLERALTERDARPASRAWVNGKTVWVQTWHARKQHQDLYGKWYPRTSCYRSTPKRRAMVAKWKAAKERVAA